MTFTIEQLEALKEGTTPGPWKFREHPDYEYPAGPEWGPMQTELEHAVLDAEDTHLFGAYNNYKMIEHPGNVPLAASAPDLVDALIAEKQAHAKLRAEVEKLRDRKRSLSKTQYQTARDLKNGIFDETFGTMPETHTVEAWEMGARSNQRTATALTRILEGNE